jgi:hypothetical protein
VVSPSGVALGGHGLVGFGAYRRVGVLPREGLSDLRPRSEPAGGGPCARSALVG